MKRILAVDDIDFNLQLIKNIFHDDIDISVFTAFNGKEVLHILKNDNEIGIDLILLDLSMPVMDGLETLKELHKNPKLSAIPVIVITVNPDEKMHALELGASDFLCKPYNIVELKLRSKNYIHIGEYQRYLNESNKYLEHKVAERTHKLKEALKLSKRTEYEITLRLGKVSEYRDNETGMHIKRMSLYSEKLAELFGLGEDERELIRYAAPLHDVGKVGIPDNILLKADKLTDEEFEIMKQHPIIGAEILSCSDEFPVIKVGKIIALQHHEKYDGSGYPNGLKGEEIHLYARIVSIADVFDALTSERIYKKAFSLEESLNIMTKGRGTCYDPVLFDLFKENIQEFLMIKEKYQDAS
jgi:putative two-component system response regulator